MWEQALFHPSQYNQREFQTLGRMQGHERDLRSLIVLVGIAYERGMVEELVEGLPAVAGVHGSIHEFAEIFYARVGFGSVFRLELFDVAGAIDEELEQLGSGRNLARRAEARDGLIDSRGVLLTFD